MSADAISTCPNCLEHELRAMKTDTLALALKIASALDGSQIDDHAPTPGRYVVVRGDRSGVFCGNAEHEDGQTIVLTGVRRIHYWDGAASTIELAERGVSRPKNCKFTAPATRVRVLDAIEVHDCTPAGEASLRAVAVWSEFS